MPLYIIGGDPKTSTGQPHYRDGRLYRDGETCDIPKGKKPPRGAKLIETSTPEAPVADTRSEAPKKVEGRPSDRKA
jgi:hypothetical protein